MVRHHLGLKQPQEGRQRAYSAFSEPRTPRRVCRVLKTPLRAFPRLANSRLASRSDTWFHTPTECRLEAASAKQAQALALKAQGLSVRAIAAQMGISKTAAEPGAKRLSLSSPAFFKCE